MRTEPVERQKERLLARLRAAGAAGATKARLGVKSPRGSAAQALQALLEDRRIGNLGSPARPCFVLSEHFNPLERACAQIERNAGLSQPGRGDALALFAAKELGKGCQGEVRRNVEAAVDWLVQERRLVKLRRGRTVYYASAEGLRTLLTPEPPAAAGDTVPAPRPAAPSIERPLVRAAYRRLASRLGYRNVEISELQRELGIPMEELKRFLLEESRQGHAVLSLGDWSLSSEAIRSGAIELFGRPHLLVRLDAE